MICFLILYKVSLSEKFDKNVKIHGDRRHWKCLQWAVVTALDGVFAGFPGDLSYPGGCRTTRSYFIPTSPLQNQRKRVEFLEPHVRVCSGVYAISSVHSNRLSTDPCMNCSFKYRCKMSVTDSEIRTVWWPLVRNSSYFGHVSVFLKDGVWASAW